ASGQQCQSVPRGGFTEDCDAACPVPAAWDECLTPGFGLGVADDLALGDVSMDATAGVGMDNPPPSLLQTGGGESPPLQLERRGDELGDAVDVAEDSLDHR